MEKKQEGKRGILFWSKEENGMVSGFGPKRIVNKKTKLD
ncbi:hypothetical protein HMPREF9130_0101 [Peptoniphilus sp. oral taxon 375 str. F0436]|nr:hypothetical protein HMPREF9130_0101 [Peptoniphilus sp. oral taxon 375 str. F0436]